MNITDVNLLKKLVGELELLNKVSRLSLLEILLVRTNHKSGSGFDGATVMSVSSGNQVSFNTTFG
jgi:hypothetical protein